MVPVAEKEAKRDKTRKTKTSDSMIMNLRIMETVPRVMIANMKKERTDGMKGEA
jgi:hypothetical protein